MAFVKIFCFWFSVRLGSIIIAIFTLIQCIIWVTLACIWMDTSAGNPMGLDDVANEFSLDEKTIKDLVNESEAYLITFQVFFGILGVSCLLLIIGALKCSPMFVYPFVITYFLYCAILLIGHILLMMNFKKEDFGIGILILYSNAGGFLILYLLYLWICVVSFVQIIHEIRKEIKSRNLMLGVQQRNGINIKNTKMEKAYLT